MQNSTKTVLVVLSFMILLVGSCLADDRGYISSQGTSQIEVAPDLATIRFSVVTEDRDVKNAQVSNKYLMDTVINSIIRVGANEEDIQTVGYNIYPVYDDYSAFKPKVKYYQVSNVIVVETKNVELVGTIIDAAVENGANEVDSIQFGLSKDKERSIYMQLIPEAAQKCKTDAELIASALGVKITGLRDASMYRSGVPMYYEKWASSAVSYDSSVPMPTPIEPGQVTMSVSVSASFFIQ
jgi:hypothetical protein